MTHAHEIRYNRGVEDSDKKSVNSVNFPVWRLITNRDTNRSTCRCNGFCQYVKLQQLVFQIEIFWEWINRDTANFTNLKCFCHCWAPVSKQNIQNYVRCNPTGACPVPYCLPSCKGKKLCWPFSQSGSWVDPDFITQGCVVWWQRTKDTKRTRTKNTTVRS